MLPPGDAHQLRTVDQTKRCYAEGARRICIVVPTGGGLRLARNTPPRVTFGAKRSMNASKDA